MGGDKYLSWEVSWSVSAGFKLIWSGGGVETDSLLGTGIRNELGDRVGLVERKIIGEMRIQVGLEVWIASVLMRGV